MENLDTNDLIERYLDGSLSPDETKSVEVRMASDANFRAEVDLHRELHAEFVDPKKLQLRDMLGDILQNQPAPPEVVRPNGLKILGIVLLALIAGWGIWRMVSPVQEISPVSPTRQEEQTPQNQPTAEKDSLSNRMTQAPKPPIAMADKAAFKSNPVFEARLGNGGIRSTKEDLVQMQSPSMGADLKAVIGAVTIHFKGTVFADEDQSEHPIQINIYASKSTDTPLAQILPDIANRKEKTEQWAFSSKQALRLPPGLYYYTIERQADSDLIFVGKFTVNKNAVD